MPEPALWGLLFPPQDSDSLVDAEQDTRQKHIMCAALLLSRRFPPANIAALFGVNRCTVYEWRDKALGYDDVEAECLRRIAGLH